MNDPILVLFALILYWSIICLQKLFIILGVFNFNSWSSLVPVGPWSTKPISTQPNSDEGAWMSDLKVLQTFGRTVASNLKNKEKEAFRRLSFDDGSTDSLVGRFKQKFITIHWQELCLKQYEEYKQGLNETSLEYLEMKRYLLQRINVSSDGKPEKQQVRDVLNGLVPQVYQLCD